MLLYLLHLLGYFSFYTTTDYLLGNSVQGKYYLLHFLNNAFLVYLTMGDVIYSWSNYTTFLDYPPNYEAAVLTFALHFYHMFSYYNKLRFDDWLHHGLMILIALPFALITKSGSLLGHSLFFTTGLPGGIDYLMLFLVRNNWMNSITEKEINNYINLWIRAPGCVAHATMTFLSFAIYYNVYTLYDYITCIITGVLIFWNGIYFMNQVVANYTLVSNKLLTNS